MRANLFYLLLPGATTLIATVASLIALRDGFPRETEITLLWAFGISVVAWLPTLLILKRIGPEYGPPPETICHTRAQPPQKPKDTSRTQGMDPDAQEDAW